MHLSPLSDGFLSDRFDDAGTPDAPDLPGYGRAHRDGLLRGLALLCVLIALLCLAMVSSAIHSDAAACPVPFPDALIHCVVDPR